MFWGDGVVARPARYELFGEMVERFGREPLPLKGYPLARLCPRYSSGPMRKISQASFLVRKKGGVL